MLDLAHVLSSSSSGQEDRMEDFLFMKKAAMVVVFVVIVVVVVIDVDIVDIVANACRQNERNSLKAKVCVTSFQFNAEVSLKMSKTGKLCLGFDADHISGNRFYEILK